MRVNRLSLVCSVSWQQLIFIGPVIVSDFFLLFCCCLFSHVLQNSRRRGIASPSEVLVGLMALARKVLFCEKSASTFYCPSLSQTSTVGKVFLCETLSQTLQKHSFQKTTQKQVLLKLKLPNYFSCQQNTSRLPKTPSKTAKAQASSKVPLPSFTSG